MAEANLSDSSGSWMADVKEATKDPSRISMIQLPLRIEVIKCHA